MNAKDRFILLILMGFLTTPLLLILLAGGTQMIAVA
jgi:hypothetical protein